MIYNLMKLLGIIAVVSGLVYSHRNHVVLERVREMNREFILDAVDLYVLNLGVKPI